MIQSRQRVSVSVVGSTVRTVRPFSSSRVNGSGLAQPFSTSDVHRAVARGVGVPSDEDSVEVEPFRIPDTGSSIHETGNAQQCRVLTVEELRIHAVTVDTVRPATSNLPCPERFTERLKRRQSQPLGVQDEFARNPPVGCAREPEDSGLGERLHGPMLAATSGGRHRPFAATRAGPHRTSKTPPASKHAVIGDIERFRRRVSRRSSTGVALRTRAYALRPGPRIGRAPIGWQPARSSPPTRHQHDRS